ncbi:hypothetical protein [Streptomyces sp. AK02-01A]|uniref:DUF7878 domain-containing protein n=1 Tax=Streptomyces sp. AK02-01A TaxID=3028648 RepID=UPI0029BC8D24|nr:hypothetical protein [Streptomyces sp. AK02-01A]MDX3853337.1 hypothetical protein [Streptomyces sp. AK02-01A]
MKILYGAINANDLRGATIADYLVNIEASIKVVDGRGVIYEEPYFPVAELARELARWVSLGEKQAPDFLFASLSFEEPGAVQILGSGSGWTVGSMFTPELKSSPVSWGEVAACIDAFVTDVRRDVLELGISPDFIDS